MGRMPPHRHPWAEDRPSPLVDHNTDRKIIGTILDAKGQPLHTVKRPDSVDFGYQGHTDA